MHIAILDFFLLSYINFNLSSYFSKALTCPYFTNFLHVLVNVVINFVFYVFHQGMYTSVHERERVLHLYILRHSLRHRMNRVPLLFVGNTNEFAVVTSIYTLISSTKKKCSILIMRCLLQVQLYSN